ncbi:hypothetical protein Pyn_29666 [Prunus yedoensis var. nudiflora]|uniref:Uncharacterized protein n=1 Tax=Prunus yedoensis var. nudiflora TaxID=2094558 RepID=A0A314YIF3_PRUYE|nr:hypothetical protein Pyn_29666 [Prunus yedoensis var. nudiflora]
MEFSSFSSRTERAVKTWQASPQDGIVTAELLEQLYRWHKLREDTNGAAVTSATEISENVMEQASQTLKNSSSWIGWKREQNVHIVKVMGLQFATYVKGQQ